MALTKISRSLLDTGVSDNSDATAITIDSSERVGIGETSPLGKLHAKVSDTGASASAQGNLLVLEDTENGLSILSGTSAAGYINFGDSDDNDIGMIIYDHSANAMRFWTNAAERMRIDTNGNVGIGDTSPHSFGSNQSGLTISDGTGGCIRLKNDAGSVNFDIENGGGAGVKLNSVNAFPLIFATSDTERMRITDGGDIGINTSSPIDGSKLDVVDTDDMTMRVRSTGASSAAVRFHNSNTGTSTSNGLFVGLDATGNGYLWNYNNFPVLIGANNTETMRVTSARGGGSGMTLSVGGNGGICFGSSEANTGGAFMAAADNAQFEGIVFYMTASASEWQPASIVAHCSKIDSDQSDHNYGNVAYGFSILGNGTLATVQKYEENPSGGAGITWSLNDLGGTTTMQIQILATSDNSTGPRIVLSAWAANYSGVLEANRS